MLTQKQRQEIIAEYAARHDGVWDAHGFLDEVRNSNGSHPAYKWFTWDRDVAATRWQVEEARRFAQGLRVKFEVREVGRNAPLPIKSHEVPFLLSPLSKRQAGGGYFVTDLNRKDHVAELCAQAALSLRQFIRRYSAAIEHVGLSVEEYEKHADMLDKASRSVDA